MEYVKSDKIRKLLSDSLSESLYVIYPTRYLNPNIDLADDNLVLGVVAVANEKGEYTTLNMPAKLSFNYVETSDILIDGKEYKKLKIEKGTPLFKDKRYIPTLDDTYNLLNDWFINSNNIPFYVDYSFLLDVMLKSYSIVGGTLAKDIIGISMLISIIGRDKKTNKYYRQTKMTETPNWVGLSDKNLSYKNLSSMILPGTYLEKGINAGINLEEEDESALGRFQNS